LVNAHSQLVDAPIRLDATFSKRDHRLIEAFDVVGQLIDTPGERTHTPRKRTHDGFQPAEAFIVLRLIVQEEFDGFLDIHLFHDTILQDQEAARSINKRPGPMPTAALLTASPLNLAKVRTAPN
jgi:hypothetical protein